MYNILIADDEISARERVKELLISNFNNFLNMYEADSGDDAVYCVKKNKIDIALMDINMPRVNGLEAIKIMKSINPNLMLIVISGYDKFEYAKSAMEYGVIGYILKPVNKEEFIGTINKALKQLNTVKLVIYQNDLNENSLIAYLEEHFTDPVMNANYLCEKFSVSNSTLLRLIRKNANLSFIEYLTKLRIEYAMKLLESNVDISINEIAIKSGYTSQHYFSRAFKNYTGLSPKKYKESLNGE